MSWPGKCRCCTCGSSAGCYDNRACSSKTVYRVFSIYLIVASPVVTLLVALAPDQELWRITSRGPVPIGACRSGGGRSRLAPTPSGPSGWRDRNRKTSNDIRRSACLPGNRVLDLPIDPQDPVLFPMRRSSYIDADETTGRFKIEGARGTNGEIWRLGRSPLPRRRRRVRRRNASCHIVS